MLEAKTRWVLPDYTDEEIERMMATYQIPSVVAKVLQARGITDPDEVAAILHPTPQLLYDPFLLPGMGKGVERIKEAVASGEKILIYGDYDVDGVSSTTLLIHVFQQLKANFSYHIPNRFSEGYGLNKEAIAKAKEDGVALIITVDTGISGVDEVAYANQLGIDVIVTDHHEPPPQLPPAFALINPKLSDNQYPFPYLAGVGVAYKLAQALLGNPPEQWLQWVALGTIADLVPLVGENHVLAALGLQQLNLAPTIGMTELIRVADLREGEISAGHIGFQLGPRINASGRLEDASMAVRLLISQQRDEAVLLAQQLDRLNRERQEMVDAIAQGAVMMVEEQQAIRPRNFLMVAGEGWNQGVIGIVASRLVEAYYLPTIVFSIDAETGLAKGSARSIAGYDMYAALQTAREYLVQFGGHPMAAGMTVEVEQLEALHEVLHQYACEHLQAEDYTPQTRVDASISLAEVNVESVEALAHLAPYGVGHPTPAFLLKEVSLQNLRAIGRNQEHLKGQIVAGDDALDLIYFQGAKVGSQISPGAEVNTLGELQINEWNGTRKPQILIRDLQVPHCQIFDCRHLAQKPEEIVDQLNLATAWRTGLLYFQDERLTEVEQLSKQVMNCSPIHIDKSARSIKVKEGRLGFGEESGGTSIDQLVLYDCPPSLVTLHRSLQSFSSVKRIYCLFTLPGKSTFFSRLPQREDFKWLYALFRQYGELPYTQVQQTLERRGWTEAQATWMIQVFVELEFITIQANRVSIVAHPKKQELESSPSYRRMYEQTEVERELLYSPFSQLADWIRNVRAETGQC